MSVLRNLEAKIGGLVEGAFSRAFKSNVQPVELARKLAKEMEENQMVSVSRVYVPNHYRVFLSEADREQFASYEPALRKELSDYLLEHARQEGLALTSRPQVEFNTDDRLELGEFGIQAQLLSAPEDDEPEGAAPAPSAGDFGHTMVYSPDRAARRLEPGAAGSPPAAEALLVGEGRAACSAATVPCSAAAATATSWSTTRTSPAATPSCAATSRAGRSSTSAPPTA